MDVIKTFIEAYNEYQDTLTFNTGATGFIIISIILFVIHDIYNLVKEDYKLDTDVSMGLFIGKYFFLVVAIIMWVFSRSYIGGQKALFEQALENLRKLAELGV